MGQILALMLVLGFFGQSAESVQRELMARGDEIRVLAKDKVIVDAVRAQNALHIPLAEIQRLDKSWTDGKNEPLIHRTTTGACADRLRAAAAAGGYGEIMLMDNQGALVCSSAKTSDYWQGDEDKWIRAFNGGKGFTFIDRPRLDESSKAILAQISVPIMESNSAIGVITVGIPQRTGPR